MHEPDCIAQISIVGNQKHSVSPFAPGIVQHVECYVNVRSLFLLFDDLNAAA